MPQDPKRFDPDFDLAQCIACAGAFSAATGLGCTVTDLTGDVLYEAGRGCASCGFCDAAGGDKSLCSRSHAYGMTEAERFGGKYIYFCPMGLTCFVSPVVGAEGSTAKLTVGPFLMVDPEDFVAYDLRQLQGLGGDALREAAAMLQDIPQVPSEKVHALSVLLFMAVGFMNNVAAANHMLEAQSSEMLQGQLSAYIAELKQGMTQRPYPFETEEALLQDIASLDQAQAQAHLNELLGHILLYSGGDMLRIKTRTHELLVLISRAAIGAGVAQDYAFQLSCSFFQEAQAATDIDKLCFCITRAMNRFIESIFPYADIKHADVLHKALAYMREHYAQKLTMEEAARAVYLSPSYFSKLFKREMGCSFNTYLNQYRIDKSKQLLRENLRLVDIAVMVGFEDQSYFTKVFKRVTGLSPNRYREQRGAGRRRESHAQAGSPQGRAMNG